MTTADRPPRARPYHHGNLREALLDAAVVLVRSGGPAALTLRETSRRTGVSANAAYRHFAGLSELQRAVADVGMTALANSMQEELTAWSRSHAGEGHGDPRAEAAGQFKAVGRGYVRYALREPGLFSATFTPSQQEQRFFLEVAPAGPPAVPTPARQLEQSLRALAQVGLMPLTDLLAAATTAWSGVHGLSLLLQGPIASPDRERRDAIIEATLDHLLRAVTGPGA